MRTLIKYSILILLMSFITCKENPTEDKQTHNVKGTIISNGIPVPKATVSLDRRADLTSSSDSSGNFSISNVPEGNYTLTVEKASSDGSFQSQTAPLSVTNDVNISSLFLPRGVKIEQPTNVMATSMTLQWNPTDANDFREYKLYRHISSGLDENSGTLIHVSTAINDTSFNDTNLNPITKYYYRVYIMNDYGKLGGSNIVSATTPNINLIQDGGFENSSAFNTNWQILGGAAINPMAYVTNTEKYSGNSSLYAHGVDIVSKSYFPVVQNTVYELSCMVKINGNRMNIDDGVIRVQQGTQYLIQLYTNGRPPGGSGLTSIDWTKFSGTFIAPSNLSIQVSASAWNDSIWYDELTIQPVQ